MSTIWTCHVCSREVLGSSCYCSASDEVRERRGHELAVQQLLRYGGHIESECRTAHDGSPCTCGWADVLRLVRG